MAHLSLLETRRDARRRLEWKLTLTKMLYDRGYSERNVIELFRFLDWLMFLPKDLQQEYRDEVERFEVERKMPYVTTIERMGIEKGIEKGMKLGSAGILLHSLHHRFGDLDESVITQIQLLPLDKLEQLSTAMFGFQSVNDLHLWLRANCNQPTEA